MVPEGQALRYDPADLCFRWSCLGKGECTWGRTVHQHLPTEHVEYTSILRRPSPDFVICLGFGGWTANVHSIATNNSRTIATVNALGYGSFSEFGLSEERVNDRCEVDDSLLYIPVMAACAFGPE